MEEKTPLQKVVDAFVDYYGEDRVDLQTDHLGGHLILVYFPRVTVTNENDRSVDITELYARVKVDSLGKLIGTFMLNRAEYSVDQWYSNYMHSHIIEIPKTTLVEFQNPCLGSGPIKDTCAHLNGTFNEDIWRLFTLELDKYVHTESVFGIPYKYLENIGAPPGSSVIDRHIRINEEQWVKPLCMLSDNILLERFLPYLIIKKPFSFGFNDRYYIADSAYNIVVKVSNLFIEWYNSLSPSEQGTMKTDMFNSGLLFMCKISDGNIYKKEVIHHDYDSYRSMVGTPLWKFKGEYLRLNITGIPVDDNIPTVDMGENTSILLHPDAVMYMVNKMLKVINYRYGTTEAPRPGQEEIYL